MKDLTEEIQITVEITIKIIIIQEEITIIILDQMLLKMAIIISDKITLTQEIKEMH